MKVAAYQAPLLPSGSLEAIGLIRQRVAWCEAEGVALLCCPEAILGGLADHARDPHAFAMSVENGQLAEVLAPLASNTVTTIVGFTETSGDRSVQHSRRLSSWACHRDLPQVASRDSPVRLHTRRLRARVHDRRRHVRHHHLQRLELSRAGAATRANGATLLFVASNNALPPPKADVVRDARAADIAHATTLGVWLVRADVAGRAQELVSYGSSAIVDSSGGVRQTSEPFAEQLLVVRIT